MQKVKFSLCKLKPKTPLHLGERELFYETTEVYIHSDTLFSAFCHSYLLLYGEKKLNLLLEKFKHSPPFVISSCFPWWEDKLYFPIPENQIFEDKRIKKKMFIEKEEFEKLIEGKSIESVSFEKFIDEEKKPYFKTVVPRIALSRLNNNPGENYFHFGEVFYKENAGLFFLYKLNDPGIEKEFKATIFLMCDEGIGGDRSVGKGFFDVQKVVFENIEFNVPDVSSSIILSLYSPLEKEIGDIKEGYYQIITRSGYIYSPYAKSIRRKTVRMFKEASVFPSTKIGKIVDVTPQGFNIHKVYRYGLAFSLPCKLEIKDEN